jgi:hypothetical protein
MKLKNMMQVQIQPDIVGKNETLSGTGAGSEIGPMAAFSFA